VDLDSDGCVSVSTWWDGEPTGRPSAPVELTWPLRFDELEDLRWYLEDYLQTPFGAYEGRGRGVADRLPAWGQAMFAGLFGTEAAREAYVALRARAGVSGAEIVLRSAMPAWLGLPWELLRDPLIPEPLVLGEIGLSRGLPAAYESPAFDVGGQRLRVLMVISRPAGARDVEYRMIARPLVRRLAAVRGRVELEVLRPPTLDALADRLQTAREAGTPFQIVHFDGHGILSDGVGMLVFERPSGGHHYVRAERVAQVLATANVPLVVLNACQSGAVGTELEAAIATRLLSGGTAAVVAMAYRVYTVAAAEFMTAFYERLFTGGTVGDAVRSGRSRMASRPARPSPKGELSLADWAVPVYYQRCEVRFPQLHTEAQADSSLDERLDRLRASEAGEQDDPLDTAEAFVGRDGLFHTLERVFRTDRVVVLHGPGGSGKTELAKAFGRWWRDTGGVARPELVVWHSFEPHVASFGLDGVLTTIGLRALGPEFTLHSPDRRRDLVHRLLREQRLLLIWDNFESVASMPDLTVGTPPLDGRGRDELRDFLRRVAGEGNSTVLVTSRTPEGWLGEDMCRVPVGGLTAGEAIEYADQILRPVSSAAPRRDDRAFAELLVWLDGHPLSMRLILPHLETTDPAVLLARLRGDRPGSDDALSASIAYSIAQLTPADRSLLVGVVLFRGIVAASVLGGLSLLDETPQRFRDVTAERWASVLDQAARVGLLTRLTDDLYGIHPALPAYLVDQWRAESPDRYEQERASTERTLLDVYAALGLRLQSIIGSGDARRAYEIINLHRRTMGYLLGYAIDHRLWPQVGLIISPLTSFWDIRGLTAEADGWADRAEVALRVGLDGAPPRLDQPGGPVWLMLVDTRVGRMIRAGDIEAAEAACLTALDALQGHPDYLQQRRHQAGLYHRLGDVACHRARWDEAEGWYQNALAIAEDLNMQTSIARSYQSLGTVARHRGLWKEAEQRYRQSLAIKKTLGDRYPVALAMDELGNLAQLRGAWDDAEQWYRDTLTIAEELGNLDGRARAYHSLGMLAQRRGRLDEAEQLYHQALTIAETARDLPGLVASYQQLGTLALLRGQQRWDEAERWFVASLAIAEQLGTRDRMFGAYQMLGLTAHVRGSLDEAESWHRRALAVADELDNKHQVSEMCHLLGRLAYDRHHWDDSEQWYHRAIAIETKMGHHIGIAVSYGQLAELAEARGNIGDTLEWAIHSSILFHQNQHSNNIAYRRLAKLADHLGWPAIEQCWRRVATTPLPADVRDSIAAQQEPRDSKENE
jgi:tetratricopeptide (TPR) repeat protein